MISLIALLILLLTIIMTSNASLNMRIQHALTAMPPEHRLPPFIGEIVGSIEVGKTKLQDYAFAQSFAFVIDSNDQKRQRLMLHCTRHRTKIKNTKKLQKKNRRKAATNVFFAECKYSILIKH